MTKSTMLWLITCLALIGLVGIFFVKKSEPRLSKYVRMPVSVRVETIKRGAYSPVISVYARVQPLHLSKLSTTVSAPVSKITVLDGQRVRKGQLLLVLNDEDYQFKKHKMDASLIKLKSAIAYEQQKHNIDKKMLKQHEGQLVFQGRRVERLRMLYKKHYISDVDFEKAKQSYMSSKLALEVKQHTVNTFRFKQIKSQQELRELDLEQQLLDRLISHCQVIAPYDGRVIKIFVADGERIRPGQVLISLVKSGHTELRGVIVGKYLPIVNQSIKQNKKMVAIGHLHGHVYRFLINRISAQYRPGQVGREVVFTPMSEQDYFFAPGQSLSLLLSLAPLPASFVIPFSSLHRNNIIYIVKNHRLHHIRVNIRGEIISYNAPLKLIIQSDSLTTGQQVLSTALPNAAEGVVVAIQGEDLRIE